MAARLISRHSYTFETQTLQRDPHTKGGGNQPRRATHEPTRHSTLYARVVERGLGVVPAVGRLYRAQCPACLAAAWSSPPTSTVFVSSSSGFVGVVVLATSSLPVAWQFVLCGSLEIQEAHRLVIQLHCGTDYRPITLTAYRSQHDDGEINRE